MGNSDFGSLLLKTETATKFSTLVFSSTKECQLRSWVLALPSAWEISAFFPGVTNKYLWDVMPQSHWTSHPVTYEHLRPEGAKAQWCMDRWVTRKKSNTWERSQPSAIRNLREEKCYSRRQLWMTTCPRTSWAPSGQLSRCLEKRQGLYFHTQLLLYDLVGKRLWRFL